MREKVGSSSTLRYILSDHLGSTSVILSDSGSVLAKQGYYPYGAERYVDVADPNQYTARDFTGQRFDGAASGGGTGLHYFRARYYSSSLGRFISADTIVPEFANPQSLNRYSYVYNNALRYTDPSGHLVDDGCRVEGCSGDPDVIRRQVLMGSLPAAQPAIGTYPSYGVQAEETYCYNCADANHPAVQAMQVVGLANDFLSLAANERYARSRKAIFVYLNYDEFQDGRISLNSLTVHNRTYIDIDVVTVRLAASPAFTPCPIACITSAPYGYKVEPPGIGPPGSSEYVGFVPGQSVDEIPLTPSGYESNPRNVFAPAEDVTVSTVLALAISGQGPGTQWPALSYQIPRRR